MTEKTETTVNFNVQEGDYSIYDLEDEFIKLYNNPRITVESIRKKLNLSYSKYTTLRRHCLNKGMLNKRLQGRPKSKRPEPSYILLNRIGYKDYFKVVKNREYYCTASSYREAEAIVNELEKCNWDKSKVTEIKNKIKTLK